MLYKLCQINESSKIPFISIKSKISWPHYLSFKFIILSIWCLDALLDYICLRIVWISKWTRQLLLRNEYVFIKIHWQLFISTVDIFLCIYRYWFFHVYNKSTFKYVSEKTVHNVNEYIWMHKRFVNEIKEHVFMMVLFWYLRYHTVE